MINQFINLPTLNFADLALLFSKTSVFDGVKGFYDKGRRLQHVNIKLGKRLFRKCYIMNMFQKKTPSVF